MKKILIRTVFDFFYHEGYKYKICGSYNTRIEACRVEAPSVKTLFSSYDIVEVDEEEANRVHMFITSIIRSMKSDLAELERGLKMLEDQGIK